jgi:hypothetical protein
VGFQASVQKKIGFQGLMMGIGFPALNIEEEEDCFLEIKTRG